MASTPFDKVYVLCPGRIAVRWCEPDSPVIYDEADASLRQVGAVAAELLGLLDQQPRSVAQLAAALLDEAPESEDLQLVERTLGDFVSLGWVRCRVA